MGISPVGFDRLVSSLLDVMTTSSSAFRFADKDGKCRESFWVDLIVISGRGIVGSVVVEIRPRTSRRFIQPSSQSAVHDIRQKVVIVPGELAFVFSAFLICQYFAVCFI